MKLRVEAKLAEAIRGWNASMVKKCQPRLCCEVGTSLTNGVDLALDVLRTWSARFFLARVTAETLLLVDFSELPHLLRDEFKRDGVVSISKIDSVGGCLFEFTVPEDEDADEGELLAAGWGDVAESVREIAKREPTATVFRGN